MSLRRLDSELVRRGLAKSRQEAKELICGDRVRVNGNVATKPATQVPTAAPIVIEEPEQEKYVSRGAQKLLGVLEALSDQAPTIEGKVCLDAGASTGGFTDVLLRRGAKQVIAVDVGYGQLAWSLRQDSRVRNLERTNIRYLSPEDLNAAVDLVVADLSFISLKLVLPALYRCAPNAQFLLMVKPQFEVGKGQVGKGGVVWDEQLRIRAVYEVAEFATELGFHIWAVEASPLPGPAGNVEYFLGMCTNDCGGREVEGDLFEACQDAVERGPRPERTESEANG